MRQLIDIDILRALAYRILKQNEEGARRAEQRPGSCGRRLLDPAVLERDRTWPISCGESSVRHPQRVLYRASLGNIPGTRENKWSPSPAVTLPETLTDREKWTSAVVGATKR
ncbi:MAG: hypothetical protein R2838_02670 [Caldilineaceae bacterium]